MKRRDFCKALVCSAALAPGLVLPRAEAAAKSQTVGRAVPAGNYTMSFRSELSQMDIEHEYYYSDSFFAHTSIQYDHQLALATLGMVTAAFNTWASDAKYWANGNVGRENSLDAAYTKLGFGDVKYRYYDVDVGRAGDFVGWSAARKTITLNGKRTTIVALILRGGGYGGEWVSNLHTGAGHAHSGFIIPVHEVFADLKNYLAAARQKGELGVVKLWMGGYSRGAVVANLLAAPGQQGAVRTGTGECFRLHLCDTGGPRPAGLSRLAAGLRQQPQRRRQPERELGREQHLQHHLQRRHRAASSARGVGLPPERQRPLSPHLPGTRKSWKT